MKKPKHILPTIVIAQFLCTSLWFAGNGVMDDLKISFSLPNQTLGYLTSAVQLGFIVGTLIFALLSLADRYSPSKVFFTSAILGAASNLFIIWPENTLHSILFFRFLIGFFLAGIYPVGMKIASDYFEKGLGKSLGYLVGALVIGTALPHLLKDLKGSLPWEFVLITTSTLAIIGGFVILLFVPDGPYRTKSAKLKLAAIKDIFKEKAFRSAAFGYFGHMWELYTFWAFVPSMIIMFNSHNPSIPLNTSLFSFLIIACGGLACILAGYLAQYYTNKNVALIALLLSGSCCIISPVVFETNSMALFLALLFVWGSTVIADSPLFSTMVAQNAPSHLKGTALTLVNCIGYTISIISIQLFNSLSTFTNSNIAYTVLGFGPILGLIAIRKKYKAN